MNHLGVIELKIGIWFPGPVDKICIQNTDHKINLDAQSVVEKEGSGRKANRGRLRKYPIMTNQRTSVISWYL